MRLGALMVIFALVSGCVATAREASPALELTLPEFRQLVHEGERLVKLSADVECAGFSGVHGLPDGWNFNARADGEHYHIEIVPPGATPGTLPEATITLDIRLRGQWSDCYSVHMQAELDRDGVVAIRSFVNDGFFGPMRETDAISTP